MAGKGLVEVKIDEQRLKAIRQMLRGIPKAMPRMMSRSINRTLTSARSGAAKGIGAEVKIRVSSIRKAIGIEKATFRRWSGTLNVRGRRVPLIEFAARQGKKGTAFTLTPGGGRMRIASAFVQTMPSGHRGVFVRMQRGGGQQTTIDVGGSADIFGTGERGGRRPIIQLFGPSPGGVMRRASGLAERVRTMAGRTLEKNIDSQVKLLLSKRRAG